MGDGEQYKDERNQSRKGIAIEGLLSSSQDEAQAEPIEHSEEFISIGQGDALSEATLWTTWLYRGDLWTSPLL